MPKEEIQVVFKNIKDIKKSLSSVEALSKEVVKRTISDTCRSAPAQITKSVREVYAIKPERVRKAGKLIKGSSGGNVKVNGEAYGSAHLKYTGRPELLTHYKLTKAKKLTANIIKGEKLTYPKGFLATPKTSSSSLPFQRTGDARYPVEVIKRSSVPQMIDNKKRPVRENIEKRIGEVAEKRLENHIKQAEKKLGNMTK